MVLPFGPLSATGVAVRVPPYHLMQVCQARITIAFVIVNLASMFIFPALFSSVDHNIFQNVVHPQGTGKAFHTPTQHCTSRNGNVLQLFAAYFVPLCKDYLVPT